MARFNLNLIKDELSLATWLAIGAAAQVLFTFVAPTRYILVPVALATSILALNFVTQLLGVQNYEYLKHAVMGRNSVMFPEDDGSRPAEMGAKPVAMFLIGIRSNHPLGRLLPAYQKLTDYLDEMYKDAAEHQATNGYLGRTPDLLPVEFSKNNTLVSISYWKSIEELEAFSRRPVHIKGLKFLVNTLLSPKGSDVGVIHEVMVCPAGHWEALYGNINPWGFGSLKFGNPKTGAISGPIYERDPKQLNGMWGRMGNRIKQAEVDEKLAAIMAATGGM
ncbi:Monooxygenase af470 [Paramyrothecium foliicola]|nr:Monooxygenase af470 [Paramyrothecium foliicola]